MHRFGWLLHRWLALAAIATALSGLVSLVTQQMWRQMANDPQIQMARDAAAMLEHGLPVDAVVPRTRIDMERSLAPFLTVFSDAGLVLASSGRLHDQLRVVPAGVLSHVREHGEERITWRPEPGVRIAAVIVRQAGPPAGFVLAGRSLRETEQRIGQFQGLVGVVWIALLGGLLVLVATSEHALSGRGIEVPGRR
jgi:hypothetical protein